MARKNFNLDAAMRADAREALSILSDAGFEADAPLTAAARLAVGKAAGVERTSLEAAVGLFLKDCLRRKLRARTVDFYESKLTLFMGDSKGERALDDFTRPELRAWLLAEPGARSTVEGYLRAIRALFRWARRQEPPLCVSDPTEGLSLEMAIEEHQVGILPVESAALVMELTRDSSYGAAAALMLFAGVRPSEINSREKPALLWGAIDFKARTVRIDAAIAKTRRARVLEGLPANLWAWLRLYRGKAEEPVCRVQTRFLSRFVCSRKEWAGEAWPQDVCRHSFATYHISRFGSLDKTSLIMGHEGKPRLLHQKYRGLCSLGDARRFFEIMPDGAA
ncbi:hypothetical protein SH580_19670 [Coraliomargarita algicola]|uniref:Integrase n=1 Tax=Coraliomargarita algicola TaxID=3092156 RepID=A0ABZ0RHH6_9BACT|nr:hypothetical protein [Coraliomargarita sp. J2-16]WPJ95640.1 hypothetical protein SH580_19670 [Coraliomargarita sp. J2-16]